MSGDTEGGRFGPQGSPKRQRPLKRARAGWPSALRQLKDLLYEVYLAAGAPSLDEITGDIADDDGLAGSPSRDTVHRVITDGERSGRQADVVAVATVLARRAAWDALDLAVRVRELWVQAAMAKGAGRPISDLRGDVRLVLDGGLGVHPALDTGGARDRLGLLPAYIPRDHDARLKDVVDAARAGRSGIAVLVGGSSTGKTRALWEAVGALPEGWKLWHPLSPTAPDAALAALSDIAPKTVVWLNEAQHYLTPEPLGEQVAAGLRELLNDPSRAPVLVLGTLWPQHWHTLTMTTRTIPDRHAGARELLGGHKIDVPDAFTQADLAGLTALDVVDPRLAQAAQRAQAARITQYLAGVPSLMERYDAARGATVALIHAAMDARRLGAGPHLPLDWLVDAAPGYLDDDEYHTLDRNWLPQALAYVTTPCNGIPGILTLVPASGPRNQRTRRRPDAGGTPADGPAPTPQGPHYLLADYLEQHGRNHRAAIIPPIDFWAAAADHAHRADLTALGNAAWDRGLYHDAAQLHTHATTLGDPPAAIELVRHLDTLHPYDHRPAQWAAAHVALDDPHPVIWLLQALRTVRAEEQVTALAGRIAAHATLDNPGVVALLLRVLRDEGADEQVTALLARDPAAHATLDDPDAVASLLRALREAGADEQVTALAERIVAHVVLDDLTADPSLLRALQGAGADEQVTALLARDPAAHATLDDPVAVAVLLRVLRGEGADEQVTALLARDPAAHATLNDPRAVACLLRELWQAGADGQASALAERSVAHMKSPAVVAWLLRDLQEAGALWPATALLARDPAAHVALDDPGAVAGLLWQLWEVGKDEHITMLPPPGPVAYAALDDPGVVRRLLQELREEAGAGDQVNKLADWVVAHVHSTVAVAQLLLALRETWAGWPVTAVLARAPGARSALEYLGAGVWLLQTLREVVADEQVSKLLARDPAAHAALDNPEAVAWLLGALQEAGADEQVGKLLARDPAAHAALDNPEAVAGLLGALQEAGADEQVGKLLARDPATHAALDHTSYAVDKLLGALQKAGADEHVTALVKRLPATGHFDLFINLEGNRGQFRLGREPDGSAASAWTWDDVQRTSTCIVNSASALAPPQAHVGGCHATGDRRRPLDGDEGRLPLACGLPACPHCRPRT
ncbi:DUF6233 domain-containing protein [Streptomyces paradoxus]|uniref:DUF6233 domain-containing protein n=1 Tax=Streptomyces paradoxus TaxID=66375 RepID=UPI0037D31FB1